MKKLYLALIAILCAVSANAATLYLKPNSNWLQANARFAAYFFGNGEKWVSMTDSDSDGIYEVAAPEGYPNVIFCRMNPSSTTNDWNNKWNQTADLKVPTDNKVLYTVADGTWDKGGGSWSAIGALEAPVFSISSGIFADAFEVSISTKYDNAIIKYSINGSDYADYSAPITISETSTVKAYAYVEGYEYAEAEVTYTKQTSDFTETTLYLTPGEWSSDNAWFAAYFYGNGDTWVKLEKVNDTTYKTQIPTGGYTSVIFCRMNPDGVIMTWDNRWNQTADLTYDGTNNLYTITGWGGDDSKATGEWSTFTLPTYHYIYVNDADYPVENLTFSAVSVSDESQSLTIGAVETGSWTITEIERTFNKRFQYVANNANFKVSYSNGTDTTEISGSEGWSATHDWYVEITKGGVTGVNEIAVDENAPIEYYNFQGVRVANPEKGMYIRVQGGKATKVIL